MVGASGNGVIYTGNTTAPACSYHTSHFSLWRWNRYKVPKRRQL